MWNRHWKGALEDLYKDTQIGALQLALELHLECAK